VKKQNDKLSKKFSVDGFPTILLLSPEGKELGRVEGYEGETPDQYIKGLEKFLSKNEKKISASVKG
jgi:thioredoxin-related protein